MNLTESLAYLRDSLSTLEKSNKKLLEAKGHMDHPEDLVFLQGSFGVQRAIQNVLDTVKNPKAITIKMDGYPALIWGYGPDGKFSVMDKHMFEKGTNSPARYIHSPQEFAAYDKNRGVDRPELHQILNTIWDDLERATPKKQGYYFGDLMFSQPLQPEKDGLLHFKANPNGIRYTVDPKSEVAQKYFNNKQAGIAVHQVIPVNAESTDDKSPIGAGIKELKQGKKLSLIPVNLPITPELKLDKTLLNNALNSERQYGDVLDKFFSTPPQAINAFTNLFTGYINKKVKKRNLSNLVYDFFEFVKTEPMTDSMRKKLLGYDTVDPNTNKKIHVPGYLDGNRDAIAKIFKIWIDVYNLKQSLVPQLQAAAEKSPIQGYLDDGLRSQEGFVSNDLKYVDRFGFSAQNLAGRR